MNHIDFQVKVTKTERSVEDQCPKKVDDFQVKGQGHKDWNVGKMSMYKQGNDFQVKGQGYKVWKVGRRSMSNRGYTCI